jgi:murein L,D-transpeptidase YcbB/YkuD
MLKLLRSSALALLLASPTMPAAFHTVASAQSQDPAPSQAPGTQPEAVATAAEWNVAQARELLTYVEGIGAEGLSPSDYGPDRLRSAIRANDGSLSAVASDVFNRLSSDLALGHVRGGDRVDWHMEGLTFNGGDQQQLLARALSGGVAEALETLHPTHPQYRGLRRALAQTAASDSARRDLIRTNMDRWRWMPRNLGARHILVNVPAFTAAVVQDGGVVARHRTVVGAIRTPTPQLSAMATGVTFNPWWNVPQSIVREMGGRFGSDYEVRRQGNYTIARQRPGPRNALGRLKVEMANAHAIYLHDTPARHLFSRDVRAFSHGCIRTQDPLTFAETLLSANGGNWARPRIDQAVESGRTTLAPLTTPVPVYISYFTAAATAEGTIITYNDIYGRDRRVRLALNNQRTGNAATASSTTAPNADPDDPSLN